VRIEDPLQLAAGGFNDVVELGKNVTRSSSREGCMILLWSLKHGKSLPIPLVRSCPPRKILRNELSSFLILRQVLHNPYNCLIYNGFIPIIKLAPVRYSHVTRVKWSQFRHNGGPGKHGLLYCCGQHSRRSSAIFHHVTAI